MSARSSLRGSSEPSPDTRRPTEPPTRVGRRVLGACAVLLVLAGVVVVRTSVASTVRISSSSMAPTLGAGDVVLVTRRPPAVDDLRRGELVMFRMPTDGTVAVKRVVGLPGESVVILDGELYVDDRRVDEPYVDHATVDGYFSRTFEVPRDEVLVLGDNRANSVDSRDYGPIGADDLLGRVLVTLWPPG